jgi:hypothetical protein
LRVRENVVKADQAHPELALRPGYAFRFAQFVAGRNQVKESSSLADPAVFTRRGVTPAHCQQTPFQFVEVFQVQGNDRIDVAGV